VLCGERMTYGQPCLRPTHVALAADQYSADAVRVALADGSDTNDDGNFEKAAANATVMRLANELAWIAETLAAMPMLRSGERNLADRVFANAISCAAHAAQEAYTTLMFREALKWALYELHNAKKEYIVQLGADGMHKDVVDTYLDVSVRILAPICPHWCEHVWGNVLGRPGTVLTAGWPEVAPPDFALRLAAEYIDRLVTSLRGAIAKKEAPPKKKKGAPPAAATPPARQACCTWRMHHKHVRPDSHLCMRMQQTLRRRPRSLASSCMYRTASKGGVPRGSRQHATPGTMAPRSFQKGGCRRRARLVRKTKRSQG
jgi:valyl-tRNA synthetase